MSRSMPFYYGWVIFVVSASTSFSSRPMMAVATLAVFLVPMTEELGWSRGIFAGAVSLGGVFAVAVSPAVGWWIDRHGSALVVALGGAISGACALAISVVSQAWTFYALYVPGRMSFASPLELGTSTAVSNWFIRRRALVLGLLNVTQGAGLALMPLVAHLIITLWDWRTAWASLGIYTLSIAVLPALLFLTRRPEDIGLDPDPEPRQAFGTNAAMASVEGTDIPAKGEVEPGFTLRKAANTRAFWMLAVFSGAGFMVQAGVSLHQAAHYIQQGLSSSEAAITVSIFALMQVPGGLFWSGLTHKVPIRYLLALSGFSVGAAALGTTVNNSLTEGLLSAGTLGFGVGGLHVLLRLTWADYYGRPYLGRIRGVTLPVQIAGQAVGPVLAGFMYDSRESYQLPFIIFAVAAFMAALLVLNATPPKMAAPEQRE